MRYATKSCKAPSAARATNIANFNNKFVVS